MPWGDGTGPMGQGPMTGRGAGYCASHDAPGSMNPGRGGRGWGRGRGGHGGGRGWRHCYYATGLPGWARVGWPAPPYMPQAGMAAPMAGREDGRGRAADASVLREQAKYLEEALADVRKSLERMDAESKDE